MITQILIFVLAGMALGLYFRVYVMVIAIPSSTLVAILLSILTAVATPGSMMLNIAFAICAIQIGYMAGLLLRGVIFRKDPALSPSFTGRLGQN